MKYICIIVMSIIFMTSFTAWGNDLDKDFELLMYYYLNPQPEKIPLLLEDLLSSEMFKNKQLRQTKNIESNAYAFGRIGQLEPSVIPKYEALFKKTSHKGRLFILQILQVCGNEQVEKFLKEREKDWAFLGEKRAISEALKTGIPIEFDALTIPIHEGCDLDYLWWDFMVTGKKELVLRIIETLKDYESRNQNTFVIARVAEWSLDSFCRNHNRVMEICKAQIPKLKGIVKEKLEEVVREIEIEQLPDTLATSTMLKAIVRDETPGLDKRGLMYQLKTFYRLGATTWRIEKPSNSKVQLVTIVKEPDIWIIEMPQKTGIHFVGPFSVNYHYPMIQSSDGKVRLRGLQLGTEVSFMKAKKAKRKSTSYEGKECILFYVNTEKLQVELICKKLDESPLKLQVSEGQKVICCYTYDEYKSTLEVDMSLFKVPEDVRISESSVNENERNKPNRLMERRPGLSPFIKDRLPEHLKSD